MKAIVVNKLTKSFKKGKVKALQGVDLEVEQGEIYGLIGPDGSGKTTLFRVLSSLLLPESGTAFVMGHNVVSEARHIHQVMGYMPGKFSLYADLSVEENLKFFAALYGADIQQNYHWIADIYQPLLPFKNRKAGKLSGGMKQKLALCCALIHAPQILFLDEPTTGVDPVSRKQFWENLKHLKAGGLTVLVSTPYMDEALRCDRIALMQNGKFLKVDTPQQIIEAYDGHLWSVKSNKMRCLVRDLHQSPQVLSAFSFGADVHVNVVADTDVAALKEALSALGHEQIEVAPILPSIEDCFMKLMPAHE